MTEEPEPEPDPFRQVFVSLIAARAVITATSIGVFDALAKQPIAPQVLADRLNLDPVGVDVLLVALRTLGYVEVAGDVVCLTPVAQALMTKSSSTSIANFAGSLSALHWDLLGQLDEVLVGRAAPTWHQRSADDRMWQAYVRGLFELSRAEHDENAALVSIVHPRQLLDLGGAHGAFAMAMCRRHRHLDAIVLDLPGSVAVGRQIVKAEGFDECIQFREADANTADFGAGLDVVSAFNFLQHFPPDAVDSLLNRIRRALRPGGCLVVGETERPTEATSTHPMGALTGLLFYVMTGTRTFSQQELETFMANAGFAAVERFANQRSPWRVVYVAR